MKTFWTVACVGIGFAAPGAGEQVAQQTQFQCGTELPHAASSFYPGVFQQRRTEAVESFSGFDCDGDGQVTWDNLLFAVTLDSEFPTQSFVLPDCT